MLWRMREADSPESSPRSTHGIHFENGEASTVRRSAGRSACRALSAPRRLEADVLHSSKQSGQNGHGHDAEGEEEEWNNNWAIIELVHNTASFGKDKEALNSACSAHTHAVRFQYADRHA